MADEQPKRPRGRPRVDEPGQSISTWVRTSDYDRLARLALKHDQSVSAVVRRLIHFTLREKAP